MLNTLKENKYHTHVKNYVDQQTEYRYIKLLGIGSYGVAYLIEKPSSDEKFVLKRMKAKHRNNRKLREKFHFEIQLLREIGLPNTPSVISQGMIKDVPFYIMEYINGQTFEQEIFIEGKTFTVEQSLKITSQLLENVILFHQKGIVHRDLRIPNILMKEEQLYIIDFGLAAYIKQDVNIKEVDNPKKAENHLSDLYFIGHFLLFLLYSNYTPTQRKERSWQEELQIPPSLIEFIERLLLIREPFMNAEDALTSLSNLIEHSYVLTD